MDLIAFGPSDSNSRPFHGFVIPVTVSSLGCCQLQRLWTFLALDLFVGIVPLACNLPHVRVLFVVPLLYFQRPLLDGTCVPLMCTFSVSMFGNALKVKKMKAFHWWAPYPCLCLAAEARWVGRCAQNLFSLWRDTCSDRGKFGSGGVGLQSLLSVGVWGSCWPEV